MLLQFRGARESQIFGGLHYLVPNLAPLYAIVLVIISFLSLLCMLHSSPSSSNQVVHPNDKLSMNLTINYCDKKNLQRGLPAFAQKQEQLERILYLS